MYTEDDLKSVKRQIRSLLIKIAILFAIFLTISLLLANNLSNPIGLIILVVGLCICEFIWGIYGKPVATYKKFLQEILTGRKRQQRNYVIDVGSKPVYKDNELFYYEILVKEDREDEMEQMLLQDTNKTFPSIEKGSWYEFTLYQNYIVDLEEIYT